MPAPPGFRPGYVWTEIIGGDALGRGNEPALCWWLPEGSSVQHAYRLRTDDGFDTGRVDSRTQSYVRLPVFDRSRRSAAAQVKVWTDLGESEWSDPVRLEAGLLEDEDWSARWVGPPTDRVQVAPGTRSTCPASTCPTSSAGWAWPAAARPPSERTPCASLTPPAPRNRHRDAANRERNSNDGALLSLGQQRWSIVAVSAGDGGRIQVRGGARGACGEAVACPGWGAGRGGRGHGLGEGAENRDQVGDSLDSAQNWPRSMKRAGGQSR